MDIDNVDNKVTAKDIFASIKVIPKTLKLVKNIDKKSFYLIMILSFLMGIAPILTLLASQNLIISIEHKNLTWIIYGLAIYIGSNIISGIISSVTEFFQNKFQTLINYNLNLKIMNKCKRLSLEKFENSEVYDMLQRVQNETPYKPFEIFLSILNGISACVTLISSITILINWKPWVLIILIVIPIIFSFYFFKIGQREFNVNWMRAPERRKAWYLTHLMTRDSSFKEIKLFNLSDYLISKYKKINKTFVKQDIKLFKRRTTFTFIFEFVEQICINIVLVVIIYSVLIGEILIGHVVAYIQSLSLISNNTKSLLNIIHSLYQNSLYIHQLFEFLSIEEEKDKNDSSASELKEINHIKISNLNFTYPSNPKEVLKNVNLEIKQGERVAIVGFNGSGKSTLIKLLLKLYDCKDDTIFINGIPINTIPNNRLRQEIGVLFQDFVKYELRLRENIGFGDINKINHDQEMIETMKKAHVDYLTDLNTQLGLWFLNGTQLSGGEWQKVAIARTFFKNASLYILDEPSSALDPISERQIIDMFMEVTENKIGIFISHRLSTAKLADKIVVMNKGEIVGVGSHEQLIENNSYYRQLYNLESIKEEVINHEQVRVKVNT